MIDRAVSRMIQGASVSQTEARLPLGPVKEPLYLRSWGDDYPYLPGEARALSSCLPVQADSPAQVLIMRMNRLI